MPSSTSSSERAIPAGDWRKTWVVALVFAVGVTAWFEHTARRHGQRPSVVDDPVAWSVARRAVDDDPRAVAFVGTSRMGLAYSAQAFADAAPALHGVQLAIDGVVAVPILEDLANDEAFRGVAVVDIIEWDITWGDLYNAAGPYVKRARALWRAPGAVANRFLAGLVQSQLAVLAVGGRRLITTALGKRRWPLPAWVWNDRDRTSHGDYSLADPEALQKKRDSRMANFDEASPTPDAWLALAANIAPLVARIRAHGGDVVIVRLPISGRLAEQFDAKYPRRLYWDVFAARCGAKTIDARDIPAMRLVLPDEMHLDQVDQAAFTRSFVDALRATGVFRDREGVR